MPTSGKPLDQGPKGPAPDGHVAPVRAGGRWSAEPPAPPPAALRARAPERDVKGLFAVGAPPPPVGASIPPGAADPIASLFASDTVVRPPGIVDAPSEAELGRWRATMQSSLFEERVVDPVPQARATPPPPPARAAAAAPVARSEGPRPPASPVTPVASPSPAPAAPAAEPAPVVEKPALELAMALEPEPRRVAALQAPVPPPAPVRSGQATKGKRGRAKVPEVAELAAVAADEEAAAASSRRRFERGPSRALLVALGIAALAAVAALVIVLGPWPGSPAAPAEEVVARLPAPVAAPAPGAAMPTAATPAPAPATAPPTAAPTPPAAPVPAPAAAPPAPTAAPAAAKPTASAPAVPESPAPARAEAPEPSVRPAGDTSSPEEEAGAPEGMLRDARKALDDDDAVAAERIARQALARAPQDHHAMELLALALVDQDRGQEALPLARRIVARRPKRVPYRLVLGDVLLMVGDEAGARAEWQKALELSPRDKAIKRRLGLP